MFQDYKDLLSAFHAHGVKYLIVGGHAVSFHAQPRFTRDLDFFVKADPANAQAIHRALAAFGAPLADTDVDAIRKAVDSQRYKAPPSGGC